MLDWDDYGLAVACPKCGAVIQPEENEWDRGQYFIYHLCCDAPVSVLSAEALNYVAWFPKDSFNDAASADKHLGWISKYLNHLGAPVVCECGAFKTYAAPRGDRMHSTWCPWA